MILKEVLIMQAKMLNIAGVLAVIMLPFLCVVSEGEPMSEGSSDQQTIQVVHHKELLGVLAEAEKAKDKWEVHKKFQTYPKAQRLETLAYALKEGTNTGAALQEIINDGEMQDRRLTSFLGNIIQTAQGKELFLALVVANRLPPDQVLLSPLMGHALEDKYEDWNLEGDSRHATMTVRSTFAEAAKAIHRITNGKIGLEKVRSDYMPSEQEKKDLIQKWRQTWNAERKPEK